MAIPAQPSAGGGSYSGPSFAAPTVTGSAFSSRPLQIRRPRGAFTLMVNPAKLGCRDGRIVPLPVKVWHEPGWCGNGAHNDQASGAILQLERQGFSRIDHGTPVVAFGESRTTPQPSTYLNRFEGVSPKGRAVVHYADAWERPRQMGHLTTWEQDSEGRDLWLVEQLAAISPELAPVQIELATTPLIERARQLIGKPNTERLIASYVGHLPVEHTPSDLASYRPEMDATTPAGLD